MTARYHCPWSEREELRLIYLWGGATSISTIAKELDRTERAVFSKAKRLELGIRAPRGWETMRAASRRTGFYPKTLRRIMDDEGIRVRRSMSQPGYSQSIIVESDRLDDAIRHWMAKESRSAAARRIGVDRETLNARLKKIGITGRFGRVLRVTDEQVKKAMSA